MAAATRITIQPSKFTGCCQADRGATNCRRSTGTHTNFRNASLEMRYPDEFLGRNYICIIMLCQEKNERYYYLINFVDPLLYYKISLYISSNDVIPSDTLLSAECFSGIMLSAKALSLIDDTGDLSCTISMISPEIGINSNIPVLPI